MGIAATHPQRCLWPWLYPLHVLAVGATVLQAHVAKTGAWLLLPLLSLLPLLPLLPGLPEVATSEVEVAK